MAGAGDGTERGGLPGSGSDLILDFALHVFVSGILCPAHAQAVVSQLRGRDANAMVSTGHEASVMMR